MTIFDILHKNSLTFSHTYQAILLDNLCKEMYHINTSILAQQITYGGVEWQLTFQQQTHCYLLISIVLPNPFL